MKKIVLSLIVINLLLVIHSHAAVTLRVIDETKGAVTNSDAWPDQSVYTWLGNTTNWQAINNMPSGIMNGNWVGMYNGLEGGKLEKTEEAWIWSFTFEPQNGLTYHWNPGVWKDANRTENHLQSLHGSGNIEFTVSSSGAVSGCITLRIKSATVGVRENEAAPPAPEVISTSIYGIYTDNPAITNSWGVNDVNRFLYHWDGTVNPVGSEPYMGDNNWAYTSSGKGWWGFGAFDNIGINLSGFKNGYLIFSVKTNATKLFEIGVGSPGKKEGKITFTPGNDPSGFQRDGQWHRMVIPLSQLVAKGLVLSHIEAPFFAWGEGEVGLIAFDEIYFAKTNPFTPVEEIESINVLQVFPNPSNGRFTINANRDFHSLSISDLSGRILYSTRKSNGEMSFEIDGSDWGKGVYFLRAIDIRGKLTMQKLMVN